MVETAVQSTTESETEAHWSRRKGVDQNIALPELELDAFVPAEDGGGCELEGALCRAGAGGAPG